MIEEAIYTTLTGAAAVTAICSTRVYPSLLPQNPTLPAVAYWKVSTERNIHHAGSDHVARAMFQFDCWAGTPKRAKELAAAIRATLHGLSGTVGTEKIFYSKVVDESDSGADEDASSFHEIIEAELCYRET